MPPTKLSVVLPVRDRENEIALRVEQVLEGLVDLTQALSEVVVVDDGSQDSTLEVLEELRAKYPQVRIARHQRPRGIEAAGQTGLERATGELVFIQESDSAMRLDDLRRLLLMSEDESVVAARAESSEEPIAPSLLRRLRQWGTDADEQLQVRTDPETKQKVPVSSVQMIRRPHLQRLAGPKGGRYALQGQTDRIKTVKKATVT